MEPWEALDLDYSDVHSLLRPLKRHRSPRSLSAAPTSTLSLPLLETCSLSPSQPQSQPCNDLFESDFSSQNPICRSQRISTELESPCPSGASLRIIPGPAGAVQAAMQRRTRGEKSFYVGDEEPVPTQEYIRRVIENGDEEDGDFNGNPWVCALDFVRGLGAMDGRGDLTETPLSSIKNAFNAEKVALVVAIIKSCTSNSLGGMMVALKDPTGTIDASIHHRVISEGNFGKDLSVGAVLILQKVAVFSPTRSVHVLNVTTSNVVKVISKDSGPPIKLNSPTAIIQPDSRTEETHGEVHIPQMNLDVSREKTQNIMNNLRQNSKLRRNGLGDLQTGKGNAASSINWKGNGTNSNRQFVDLSTSKGTSSMGCNTLLVDQDQQTGLDEPINHPMGTDSGELSQAKETGAASNTAQAPNNQEAEKITRTQEPLLPQWTEEQLDELFAFD
ncbi:uncharacterized protein C17orf53 [Cucurbita pepo subsp. pepo]|uniref:uncharacterized protein C17orf53 n=1 Tax=Cucurbita pepo subsp. pepo TaxID=3664 RepID=UPI000C9D7971|nr:uncharacterized protein C17orf53 [Cucurbita pepo subsp. pepo]